MKDEVKDISLNINDNRVLKRLVAIGKQAECILHDELALAHLKSPGWTQATLQIILTPEEAEKLNISGFTRSLGINNQLSGLTDAEAEACAKKHCEALMVYFTWHRTAAKRMLAEIIESLANNEGEQNDQGTGKESGRSDDGGATQTPKVSG